MIRSDVQQIAVCFQRAVRFMRENTLGEHLAKLHALLVEAVQIPAEALEHHFVFKVRQQLFRETIAEFMGNGLDCELDEHLGYDRYDTKRKTYIRASFLMYVLKTS